MLHTTKKKDYATLKQKQKNRPPIKEPAPAIIPAPRAEDL